MFFESGVKSTNAIRQKLGKDEGYHLTMRLRLKKDAARCASNAILQIENSLRQPANPGKLKSENSRVTEKDQAGI